MNKKDISMLISAIQSHIHMLYDFEAEYRKNGNVECAKDCLNEIKEYKALENKLFGKERTERAIEYVRVNKTWEDDEKFNDKIACEIADLLNEYGWMNKLLENYWFGYTTVEDAFNKIKM